MKLILSYDISGDDDARHAITGAMIGIAVSFGIKVGFLDSEDQTNQITFTYDDKDILSKLKMDIKNSLQRLEKEYTFEWASFDVHYSN